MSIFAALCGAAPAFPATRVWQDSIALPTYLEGSPDTTPALPIFSSSNVYPYTIRKSFTGKRVTAEWRRINLENEYLSCSFLPDLGGHLYSCIDKLNGHPLFYANPSIKKASIAVRGAWAALGMEMNFPAAHSATTVSPLDFAYRQDAGQAAVWVGGADLASGMEWVSEFVLRDGSAVLEQSVTLQNPTGVRRQYHWWTNAAVPLEKGTQFVLPARMRLLHGSTLVDSWPVAANGIDESVAANNRVGAGYFAIGSREPFMAVYHAGSRTAVVHVADPGVVPGKKVWTWGTETDAEVRKMLSDNNSQYVELQAGLMATQDEHRFLGPHESLQFTEYWMAARELGGVSRATRDAILSLTRKSAGAKPALAIELNVTHAISRAVVRLKSGATTVFEETVDLDPAAGFSRSVENPAAAAYRFELLDRNGAPLLFHTEGEYDAEPAAAPAPGIQAQLAWGEQVYLDRGAASELRADLRSAEHDYRTGLAQSPASASLKKALGRVLVTQQRWDEALPLLAEAPQDAETHYYSGLAHVGLGREEDARAEWSRCLADDTVGPAAMLESGASWARSGEFDRALDVLRLVLEKRPPLIRAGRMQLALLRKTGQAAEHAKRLRDWLARAPGDSFLRFEQVRAGGADEALGQHLGADPERVLAIAGEYLALGLYADALSVLDRTYPAAPANQMEPGAVLPQNHPLVLYCRGYVRSAMGGDGAAEFKAASALPVAHVFPHGASSRAALWKALEVNPEDSSAHWFMGLLSAAANRIEETLAEWRKIPPQDRRIPGLSNLLSQAALAKIRPAGGFIPDVAVIAPATNRTASTPEDIVSLALTRAASGGLSEGQGLFTADTFPQQKQPELVQEAYIELQLQAIIAQAAAGKCAAALEAIDTLGNENKRLPFTFNGFGAFMRRPRFQYYLGEVESACGNASGARKRWSKLVKTSADPASPDFAFAAVSLARLQDPAAPKAVGAALAAVEKALAGAAPESNGFLLYSKGLLLRANAQPDQAMAAFKEGADSPGAGPIAQFLNLLALQNSR